MHLATKLVSTRRGTLLVAMLIALVAGASILLYLNSYRESLKTESALVTVLVAKRNIPKGTAGVVVASKDLYTVTTVRESQLLEGAMSDPATLRGRVATREIFEGAQLTATDFGAAGDSLAAQLTDRQRVVTVPFDSAHGLIDAIEVGNRVDVYAGFKVVPVGIDGRPVDGGQARSVLRLILTDVPVLAIGERSKGAGSGKTNVSLGVDDLKAAEVAFASDNGQLWMALRPSAGAKASRPDIVTVETLLLGVPPVQMLRSLGGRS
jgi:Flp pilus assembly protein CpaB